MKKFAALLMIFCFSAPLYPQTIVKTPQDAARGLFQAWGKRQRRAARNYARAEAVEKLFGVRRQQMIFKGCAKREEGDYECLYENKKLDLTMAMIVEIFRVGYRVTEVSFSSEAV
jgi:hypothetical protein